jgi:hypothetical protein
VQTVRYAKARQYQLVPGTAIRRPMLRVRVSHGGQQTPQLLALLDSGADVSLFHSDLAVYLGIDLASCPASQTGGIGGGVTVYPCSVWLEVEGERFQADVQFSPDIDPTILLLGRDNVFDKFQFGFDPSRNAVLFSKYR